MRPPSLPFCDIKLDLQMDAADFLGSSRVPREEPPDLGETEGGSLPYLPHSTLLLQ